MLPSIEGGAIIGKVWAEASQCACVARPRAETEQLAVRG